MMRNLKNLFAFGLLFMLCHPAVAQFNGCQLGFCVNGVGTYVPPVVQGSTYNFVANTATVNSVAQPSSISNITDTRATTGYDLAATTQFAANTPRRTSAGLLIEYASTNNVVQSQAFNNASWTKTGATVADNAVVAPDGTTTASTLTNTGTGGTLESVGTIGVSSSVPFTATIFVKQGTAPYTLLWISDGGPNYVGLFFSFSTNTYGSTAAGGEGIFDANIAPVNCGNGWWRIGLRGHFTGNLSVHPYLFSTAANNALATTSGQTGNFWGYQFEGGTGSGVIVSSSYIPTTSGAATRAIDALVLSTASNASTAIITFSDNTTQNFPVNPQNNTLNLSPSVLNETLITSISVPAPVTSYIGAVSSTSISYNEGATDPYISCKYVSDPFKVAVPWFKIRIPSWYLEYTSSTYTETNNPQALIEKWSVEYPPGTFTPITFAGVSTGSTVTPGTDLISDQINVAIPAGATPNLWLYGQNPSAGTFPDLLFTAGASTSACSQGTTPNDQTTTGGTITGTNGGQMGPTAIIGPTGLPSVLSVGDSRTRVNGGEIVSTLSANNIAYIQTGTYGDRAAYFVTRSFSPSKRATLQAYVSHIVVGYGINDLLASTTDGQLRAFMVEIAQDLNSGKPLFISTVEASSTSTDSWATVTGQTANVPVTGALETHNIWRRTTPTPYVAVWDIVAQTGQINGSGFTVWNAPGYTTDGLHASTAGIAAIVSSGVVNISNFRM
jgi:hypothetical protein